jgi:hypothetical protein
MWIHEELYQIASSDAGFLSSVITDEELDL